MNEENKRVRGCAKVDQMAVAAREDRDKMKNLALELVRTAAEQGVSVRDFLYVLELAKSAAMGGKLNPPD